MPEDKTSARPRGTVRADLFVFAKTGHSKEQAHKKEVAKSGRTICNEIADRTKGRLETKIRKGVTKRNNTLWGANKIKVKLDKKYRQATLHNGIRRAQNTKQVATETRKNYRKPAEDLPSTANVQKNAKQSQATSSANNAT